MNTIQSTQPTQTSQLVPASTPVENPSAWMRDGYSPTEIIIAVSILASVSLAGVAKVIVAITGLVKSLTPVMVRSANQKTK
jgi:hypothetical protein